MRRYRFFQDCLADCYCEIEEASDGEIVYYTDHQEALAKKDAELAIAEKKALESAYRLGLANDKIKQLNKRVEDIIGKCVCGHYHCPICENQMEVMADGTYRVYLKAEIKQLRDALIEILKYPEERVSCDIAKAALKEGV